MKEQNTSHHEHMVSDFRKRFYISLVLTVPVLALSEMFQELIGFTFSFPGSKFILIILSIVIYIYGGKPFLKGVKEEIREKQPGMMTLIGLAISIAFFYSLYVSTIGIGKDFFWELATLIDIMLLGHWIEMRSVMGASRALEEIVRLLPTTAHLKLKDGSVKSVDIEDLMPGDVVLVKPGEKVPSDGVVIEGKTYVNEAMLTGESKPVLKEEESEVMAGSINGEGAIIVEIKKSGNETYLSQVVELVKKAQESRSRSQDIANRAAFYLTVVAISVGVLTFVAWLIYGKTPAFALERMVTVMVITCPHALGLAIPLVVAVSTSLAARSGFLIRNRTAFERARGINYVVFDKTGTLTIGKFGVVDIIPVGKSYDRGEILSIAASLENQSQHPIAAGIVESAKEKDIEFKRVDNFNSVTGKGVEAKIDGKDFKVVSPGYVNELGLEVPDKKVEDLSSKGQTVVYVVENDEIVGLIGLGDEIREESRTAITKLNEIGIKCGMLTGDNKYTAKWVAEELGLDEYFSEVLPHQKSEKIKEIQSKGYKTAMVGDGVNDAPALVQADIGIAIGAGTDVAIESADIILVRNDPRDVFYIAKLSRETYRKMVQNLFWATGYNLFAIPLAAGILFSYGVLLNPAAGAILMSLSTVIVAFNSRLFKYQPAR